MSLLLLLYNLLTEEGGSFVDSTAIVVKFPAYFPENCPPAEAIAEIVKFGKEVGGDLYRRKLRK